MGLTKEKENSSRRPSDWAYIARFDRKDLPSLEEMARHIRETHDVDMIQDFNRKCEQKLKLREQDQRQTTAVLDNGVEIQSVTKAGDLVVNTGLRHCINIILGQTSARFSHFGMSPQSPTPAAVTDTALSNERIADRVVLAWAESVGMRMFFGGISRQDDVDSPAGLEEIGVYNGSAAGAVLLNRTIFRDNDITRNKPGFTNVQSAPMIVSAVIEFCPKA